MSEQRAAEEPAGGAAALQQLAACSLPPHLMVLHHRTPPPPASPAPPCCSLSHGTPDAVFPNNWFSTHPAGEACGGVKQDTLVFYPMKCPNRCALPAAAALVAPAAVGGGVCGSAASWVHSGASRAAGTTSLTVLPPALNSPAAPSPPLQSPSGCRQAERREDIKEVLQHWGYHRTLDMSPFEAEGQYFEVRWWAVLPQVTFATRCAPLLIPNEHLHLLAAAAPGPACRRAPASSPPKPSHLPLDPTALRRLLPAAPQGTGVLVIDRINGVAYVALSERADKALAEVRRRRRWWQHWVQQDWVQRNGVQQPWCSQPHACVCQLRFFPRVPCQWRRSGWPVMSLRPSPVPGSQPRPRSRPSFLSFCRSGWRPSGTRTW